MAGYARDHGEDVTFSKKNVEKDETPTVIWRCKIGGEPESQTLPKYLAEAYVNMPLSYWYFSKKEALSNPTGSTKL